MPITINGNGAISGLGDIDGHDLETNTLVVSGDTTIAPQAVGRASLFIDDSTNSVGINTTTPAAAVFLEVADGTDPIVSLNNTGNGEVRVGCTAAGGYIGTESNHPFNIETNSATAVSVLANGNVGIGVTNPSDKLEVLGDVRLIPPSGPNTLINFEYNNGTFAQIRGNGRNSAPLYGDIEFWTKDGGDSAPVERLVVRAEGRVGINTATPSRTFDVESNVGEVTTYFKRNVTGSSDTAQGVSVFSLSDASRTTGEGFGPSINFEHRDNVTAYAGAQISSEREADGNRSDLVFYSRRYGYQETFRATADQALQLSANCLGIDFSLIAGSSSGSVTSNTLDDYEEGTWTPTLLRPGTTSAIPTGDFTTFVSNGEYVKIGDIVYITGSLTFTGNPETGSNTLQQKSIGGLPYQNGAGGVGMVSWLSLTALNTSTAYLVRAYTQQNQSFIRILMGTNQGGTNNPDAYSADGTFNFSCVYNLS